jgi:hypothetical protein
MNDSYFWKKLCNGRTIKYIVLLLTFLTLNGLVGYYYQNNARLTDGSYIYPLDDTYIHLAMAKNWALHNTWGVTAGQFSSTSSSPVYSFMLGVLIRLFGDSALYPLYVNIIFGNLIIVMLFVLLRDKLLVLLFCYVTLFTTVLLHIQILSGMEHTLHILSMLAAFILFSKIRRDNFRIGKNAGLLLCVLSLLPLVRYESIFFILAVVGIFCVYKQFKFAFVSLFCAFLPMTLFGIYSIAMGGFFFPNSLLVKGDIVSGYNLFRLAGHYLLKLGRSLGVPLFYIPIISLLTITALDFVNKAQYNLQSIISMVKSNSMVFIILITILLHALFARFGWLYRYEAYLYAVLYLLFYLIALKKISSYNNKVRAVLIAALFITLLPYSTYRLLSSHTVIKTAGKNIYDQQIQMSRFLHAYYNEEKVMANDIGAITYFTHIDLLDLVGLGSNSIMKIKMGGYNRFYNSISLQPV